MTISRSHSVIPDEWRIAQGTGGFFIFPLLFLTIALGVVGCSKEPYVKKATPVGSLATQIPQPDLAYRIQVGDQLDIKFFYNEELNEEVAVRPDGRISLQLIPEVVAAGKTPEELTAELKQLYEPELSKPAITVIVRTFTAHKVFVDGEVAKPGALPLTGPTSVMQVIALSGGLKETARTQEIVLIRRQTMNDMVAIPINLEAITDGTRMGQDVLLAPYDIVYIPRSPIANASLWVKQYLRETILVLPQDFLLYYSTISR